MASNAPNPANMATNTAMKKPGAGAAQPQLSPGGPVPNSDIFFFVNGAFRKEFEVCAQLTTEYDMVQFEADLVKKLDSGETIAYQTSLRVPRGCMMRAKVHPVFRRLMVQSMWLQQQPAMLRYKGGGQKIDPRDPVCECAGCNKPATRFVGNPGFFAKKNMLLDPFCVPVCADTQCVLQAQQMGNKIHAQAGNEANRNDNAGDASSGEVNPSVSSRGPNSVKSCNMCGSFEQAYGGTAAVLRACPLCGIAHYCSQQCQIQDWQRGHKDVCKPANTAQAQALAQARQAAQLEAAKNAQAAATSTEPASVDNGNNGEASAGTPAPAPAPMRGSAAPAPAPMPMAAKTPAPAPAPAPMPTKSAPQAKSKPATPTYKVPDQPAATASGGGFSMPTYNMPEPEAPISVSGDGKSKTATGAGIAMPTYKMPEPAVEIPSSTVQGMADLKLGTNKNPQASTVGKSNNSDKPGMKKGSKKKE